MALPSTADTIGNWKLGEGGEDTSQGPKGGAIGGGRFGRQPLYSNDTTQHYPIGYRWDTRDGRCFRYGYFYTAVAAGKLAAVDASIAIVDESAATTVRNAAGSAADIASSATVTSLYFLDTDKFTAANSDDVLAGGYVHVANSDTGGNTYRIRSNGYTATTSVMQVDLYDSLVGNITSESEIIVSGNPYSYLAIANNGTDDYVAGVAFVDAAATSYGWVQTWGPATVLADESAGTISAGTIATLSDGVNGAVQPMGGGATINTETDSQAYETITEPIIGYFIGDITDKNFVAVYLQLAP